MKIEVVTEKENPLLKRKEIIISLDYDGKSTISKADLQKLIAEQFKAGVDSVEITKILSEVGIPKGRGWIKIWNEKKVPIYSEIKKEKAAKPKEEAKKEEKPKEAPKEEAKE
jgi:small subunit ribosomal protein S24e